MGTFNSTKTFPYSVEDVAPVAQDVMHHFEEQDYEVTETNIPTAITLLVFWPVIIAQVWNMAHESNLDDEALDVAEESLKSHASEAPSGVSAQ